ncbi:hypothetical protein ENBRE01_3291, partial [Enteropsectra breve]
MSISISVIAAAEICFPKPEEYNILKAGFAAMSTMQEAILAIDGAQIKISRPTIAQSFDFYDRKGCFSITFICAVDFMQRFRGITYGFGKSLDARIYRGSNLRNLVERITDDSVYVLADSAFSGFPKIRTCTSSVAVPLSAHEQYNLAKQWIVVENAFGRFKGKFKRFEMRIRNGEKSRYVTIIKAAMWIHN